MACINTNRKFIGFEIDKDITMQAFIGLMKL